MNPETNKFERLSVSDVFKELIRPDGTPVPKHWVVFSLGELVAIKDYTFKVAYIGEGALLLEPVRPEDALIRANGDLPCVSYHPGTPNGDCETDGHYQCAGCAERKPIGGK